jgi:hypothetical protein
MFIEIQSFIHLKWLYFQQFQSYIELSIIISSWISLTIYILGYKEFKRISSLFEQTNGYVYINLQLASYINDVFIFSFGLCYFFGIIKFLHLCRFNQQLILFTQTFRNAVKELISFTMMFSIIFASFLCLFYLLFNSKLWSCSSLLQTIQMLFEMISLKYNTNNLTSAATYLGPICFSLFIVLVVFICLSMFISIIIDNFRRTKANVNRHNNQAIFSFMFDRFLRWTGIVQ